MRKLLLKSFLLFSSILTLQLANAQVQGISYTLAPYGEYNWFHEKSGISNGWIGGAQLGLGFGEFVELRANYARGLSLNTDLTRFGFTPTDDQLSSFIPMDVNLTRYGGELKLNLLKGPLLPYITLGTGVQTLGIDTFNTNQQIYLNGGLGVKFSAGDRYTIGLQAINTRYRFNSVSSFFTEDQRESYGLNPMDFETENLSNWSLRASLVFYIGGRKPGEMSDIDKAYYDSFSGGFRGLSVPLEFQASKMNFHTDLPYKDTYMAGGGAGLNFGPLVGVRGFYWRAIEEGEITKFDDLSMYGGEARFKLNEGKGFTPWLTIGGGNIHAGDNYSVNTDTAKLVANKGFAMGGVGIDLPFSKYVKATGFARSILTTNQNLDVVNAPEEVKASWNYGVSLNFVLGQSKKKVDVVKQSTFDDYILNMDQQNAAATQNLKEQYEARVAELELEKSQAIADRDAAEVDKINKEQAKAEKVIDELNRAAIMNPRQNNATQQAAPYLPSSIHMTPAEFQLIMRDLIDALKDSNGGQSNAPAAAQNNMDIQSAIDSNNKDLQLNALKESIAEMKSTAKDIKAAQKQMEGDNSKQSYELAQLMANVENRMKDIETMITKHNLDIEFMKQNPTVAGGNPATANSSSPSISDIQMQRDLQYTNQRLDDMRDLMIRTMEEMKNKNTVNFNQASGDTIILADNSVSNSMVVKTARDYDNSTGFFSKFRYKGMSGFAGFNVGGNTTFNLGYRLHYAIGKDSSNFEFMPESFFGFGSPSSFGITANGIYHMPFLTKSKLVTPYIGLGAGFMKVGNDNNADKLIGAWNFIVGSSLNIWAGDLYVDFTARNKFKYNQIIVGYKFPF